MDTELTYTITNFLWVHAVCAHMIGSVYPELSVFLCATAATKGQVKDQQQFAEFKPNCHLNTLFIYPATMF